MRQSRAEALKVISGIDVHVLQVPVGTVEAQLARFNQNPNVLYAEPDINHIVIPSITIMTPVCIGSRGHPWPALMLLAQLRYFGHTNMRITYPILQLAKMPLAYLVTR